MAEPTAKITRDDIESKLRAVKGDVDNRAQSAKQTLVPAGIAMAIVLLLLSYLIGKRVGKKKSTIVEIRRV